MLKVRVCKSGLVALTTYYQQRFQYILIKNQLFLSKSLF